MLFVDRIYHQTALPIKAMAEERSLAAGLSVKKARDILWAFTGRDLYRMLVVEQGWASDDYEKWIAEMLVNALVGNQSV